MEIRSFRDLTVWNKSMELARMVYCFSDSIPQKERFGLISQMQRAAVSIPSNIAEGYQRKGTKELIQFLRISYGSSAELETQLLLARSIYNLNVEEIIKLLTEVQKMLNAYQTSLIVRLDSTVRH
jgi:four helix bundle protein